MFSISTFSQIRDYRSIITEYNLNYETTSLIFIGNHTKHDLQELKLHVDLSKFRSAHGPFFDLIPATGDAELRELIMRRFKKTLSWLRELKIHNVIFHTGWFPKTSPDELWIENSRKFWTEIIEYASPEITVFIENVYEDIPNQMKELIDQVGQPNFKVCLDIGHVNANSTKKLDYWLSELGSRIGHIHVHNNNGTNDDHFGITTGTLKFPETFDRFRKYCPEAYWNLEIKTEIQESLEMTMKYIEGTT